MTFRQVTNENTKNPAFILFDHKNEVSAYHENGQGYTIAIQVDELGNWKGRATWGDGGYLVTDLIESVEDAILTLKDDLEQHRDHHDGTAPQWTFGDDIFDLVYFE